jgi:hypothetical protein
MQLVPFLVTQMDEAKKAKTNWIGLKRKDGRHLNFVVCRGFRLNRSWISEASFA